MIWVSDWKLHILLRFIEGTHLISDHASLQWLFNLKNLNGRLARWVLRMQQFDFKINHRPGSQKVVSDALSRDLAGISYDVQGSELMDSVLKNPGMFSNFQVEGGTVLLAGNVLGD